MLANGSPVIEALPQTNKTHMSVFGSVNNNTSISGHERPTAGWARVAPSVQVSKRKEMCFSTCYIMQNHYLSYKCQLLLAETLPR